MPNALDDVIRFIIRVGYHNQRRNNHSETLSEGIFRDLKKACPSIRRDLREGRISKWTNVRTPGARERKIDLLIGEPDRKRPSLPDLRRIRIAIENKSV